MTDNTTVTTPEPPKTPAEASARLTTLQADKAWADKLLTGSVAERREFDALVELASSGDKVDAAIAGVVPDLANASGVLPDSGLVLMANVAADLRDKGHAPGVVKQALLGKPVSQDEYTAVKALRDERMTNKEWSARLLGGDKAAAKELTLMNIIIANGTVQENQ
jgi:hypothetical protein